MESNNIKYNDIRCNNASKWFKNVVNDKFENVHRLLFMSALKKYFEANDTEYQNISFDDFLKAYNIVELRNKDYAMPSKTIISSKKFPYTRTVVDLAQWWNEYQFNETNKGIDELIADKEAILDAKLVYIDYANNKCKFRSKTSGKELWTTLDYMNENTMVDDEYSLKNTFGQLAKNI